MSEIHNPKTTEIQFNGKTCTIYYFQPDLGFDLEDGTVGIYVLLCLKSGSAYVGSSRNIRVRASGHLDKLSKGKHKNKKLRKRYAENPDRWACAVLDVMPEASPIDLLFRERSYIDNPLFDLNISRSGTLVRQIQRLHAAAQTAIS